tara:strand:+ start:631 stop:975 length:345 start_codon:yes stop_codon:yes gene_type:complete
MGLNDSWSDGKKTVTLRELLNIIKDVPIQEIPINKLSDIVLNWENSEEQKKIESAELKYPSIIIINNDDTISYILDGNHRIQKTLQNDLLNIKVKLIKIKDLPIDFQEVLRYKL